MKGMRPKPQEKQGNRELGVVWGECRLLLQRSLIFISQIVL